MTIPKRLTDRLMVVSRDDYVYVRDENPELLKDDRVTIVPVPLLGRWIEFPELRNADLSAGEVLVRDPDDAGRYLPAQEALSKVSRARCRLFLNVCQHLGAKLLKVRQFDSRSDENIVNNRFHAGATAAITSSDGKNTDKIDHERGFSAALAGEVRRQLRAEIETNGRWRGGDPDIMAARNVIADHEKTVDSEISTLIEQRESPHNPISSYSVNIDFFGELHRHFSLLAELARRFEATIGNESLSVGAKMSNAFEWNNVVTQQGKLAIEVWFVDPPTQPDLER